MKEGITKIEVLFQKKNKEPFWVEITSLPVKEDGKLKYLLSCWVDITERKKAGESLEKSEERFRNVFEQSPIGIEIYDRDGKLIDANKKCLETFGIPSIEDVRGFSIFDDCDMPETERQKIREGKPAKYEALVDFEKVKRKGRYQTNKSGLVWLDVIVTPFRPAEGGPPEGYMVKTRDITERKRAEERFVKAFRSSPDVLVITRIEDSKIIDVNDKWKDLFEYSKKETIGHSALELGLFRDPMDRQRMFEQLAKKGFLRAYDVEICTKSGRIKQASVSAEIIEIDGKNCLLGTIQDITERKQTEKKLLDYHERLKSLAAELSLAEERERHRIAMELHDRVSQSLAIAKIKLDTARAISPCPAMLAATIDETRESISSVIKNTRSLTFDLGFPALYDLGFEAAVAGWLTEHVQQRYGIEAEFEKDTLAKPLDDNTAILLFRTVRELLTNVIKHARAHKVKVSVKKIDSRIQIVIEDDGIGFDVNELLTLPTRKGGFGLFSIKERLKQMTGEIKIESEHGKGTKVTVTAPLKMKQGADNEENKNFADR